MGHEFISRDLRTCMNHTTRRSHFYVIIISIFPFKYHIFGFHHFFNRMRSIQPRRTLHYSRRESKSKISKMMVNFRKFQWDGNFLSIYEKRFVIFHGNEESAQETLAGIQGHASFVLSYGNFSIFAFSACGKIWKLRTKDMNGSRKKCRYCILILSVIAQARRERKTRLPRFGLIQHLKHSQKRCIKGFPTNRRGFRDSQTAHVCLISIASKKRNSCLFLTSMKSLESFGRLLQSTFHVAQQGSSRIH